MLVCQQLSWMLSEPGSELGSQEGGSFYTGSHHPSLSSHQISAYSKHLILPQPPPRVQTVGVPLPGDSWASI